MLSGVLLFMSVLVLVSSVGAEGLLGLECCVCSVSVLLVSVLLSVAGAVSWCISGV